MNIAILNCSPKGKNGTTGLYTQFLRNKFNNIHDFTEIELVKKGKKNWISSEFRNAIKSADLILWATPVYFFSLPSQVLHFIKGIFSSEMKNLFVGKYATSLLLSTHIMDNFAYDYIKNISLDLKMNYIDGFSAFMLDLKNKKKRVDIVRNYEYIFNRVNISSISYYDFPDNSQKKWKQLFSEYENTEYSTKRGRKILLIADIDNESNTKRLVNVFCSLNNNKVTTINLRTLKMHYGCEGHLSCCYDGNCIYEDDMYNIYRNDLKDADAIIFASKIENSFATWRLKAFIDRLLPLAHHSFLRGKQFSCIFSGKLSNAPILEGAMNGLGEMLFAARPLAIISDECQDESMILKRIKTLSNDISWCISNNSNKTITFLGFGQQLIMRDCLYAVGSIYKQSYLYFKNKRLFNYPQKDFKGRVINVVLYFVLLFPKMRKNILKNITGLILHPLKRHIN